MENRIIFREMLSEIKAASDVYGGRISKAEIREILSDMPLTEEHYELIYEYLAGQNIRVTESRAGASESEEERQGQNGVQRNLNDEKIISGSAQERQGAEEARLSDAQEGQGAEEARLSDAQEEAVEPNGADGKITSGDRSAKGNISDEKIGGLEGYLHRLLELAEESFEDEHALLERVLRGDEAAKARLIESYLPLICEAAGNFGSEEVLLEDLIQEGNLGLLEALESLEQFDSPAACSAHILNSINEAMTQVVISSREKRDADGNIVSRVNHLNEAVKNLERDLEHKVSAEELSAYLEMPLQEIRDILRMSGDQIELEGENR